MAAIGISSSVMKQCVAIFTLLKQNILWADFSNLQVLQILDPKGATDYSSNTSENLDPIFSCYLEICWKCKILFISKTVKDRAI